MSIKMDSEKFHIRVVMLFFFKKGEYFGLLFGSVPMPHLSKSGIVNASPSQLEGTTLARGGPVEIIRDA